MHAFSRLLRCLPAMALALALPVPAQNTVTVSVDAHASGVPWRATWDWFGADEPNYITTPAGRALLRQMAAIAPGTPVYFRPHNLLTTGNGQPSLKWGSTNVYTQGPNGKPVYSWTITDGIFDTLVHSGITPFVEIGFTPEALSPHPHPYRHHFPENGDIFTGWSYPPDNDAKWSALITAWAGHLRARYGPQAEKWRWEVWNEPDIPYFHGTPAQYFHLYDITVAAVRKAIPGALVGGPAVTGPYGKNPFLHDFLEHCAHGKNAATGGTGAPLTFISFHPKGAPVLIDDSTSKPVPHGQKPQGKTHVRMGLYRQLDAMRNGFRTVASFPEFNQLPVILSESDPEGCAACTGPASAYRNGDAYSASVIEATARSLELARRFHVHLEGAVNWSFIFPGQKPFAGFRSLATWLPDPAHPLVDKPVLNAFRMMGMLGGEQLPVESSGALPVSSLLKHAAHVDVDAVATRRPHELDVLVWNYSDSLAAAPAAPVSLTVRNLPAGKELHLARMLVDQDHSNAYTAWKQMGRPEHPTAAQVAKLPAAARLAVVANAAVSDPATPYVVKFKLERNAATLLRLTWR